LKDRKTNNPNIFLALKNALITYCCILQAQLLRNQEKVTIFIPHLWHMAASFNEKLAETTYSATGFLGISARGEAERW